LEDQKQLKINQKKYQGLATLGPCTTMSNMLTQS
jgi:hypothetical protein